LTAGAGPPLLFLHGAGGAGRWLPFQERLATTFTVYAPSHPGHGGSPDAPRLEHISDLASHYLDLLDALGLDRVRLLGPPLLCWGAHDRLAPWSPCGETWAKEIPEASRRVFADSGHVPHLEEPAAVAAAVIDFCRSAEGGA